MALVMMSFCVLRLTKFKEKKRNGRKKKTETDRRVRVKGERERSGKRRKEEKRCNVWRGPLVSRRAVRIISRISIHASV